MTWSLTRCGMVMCVSITLGCDGRKADRDTTTAGAAGAATAPDTLTARVDAARIQGSPAAPVWVVEISDFQCPFCKTWHDSVYRALHREFVTPGTVRLAYINYPLPNHHNALPAAEAAMCAGVQNKFWEMHDGLFETQSLWSPLPNAASIFDSVARAKGVDVPAMRRCIDSGATRALIVADAERARESGVQGTPTFIVGGDVIMRGMQPIEAFREAIGRKLAAREPAPP